MEKTIYPEGNYEEIEYDNNGNPLKVADREGNVTTTFYDALNWRIGVMDALWNTTPSTAGKLLQIHA
ncbi:MAG: RHS repeat protein [Planctomycetes bacterium]|nr:RHS repeat protein [Planctomycetota bacterium]